MKRIIPIALILLLSACGSSNNDANDKQANTKEETPAGVLLETKVLHKAALGNIGNFERNQKPFSKVFTNQADYAAALGKHAQTAKAVDFTKNKVAYFNAGLYNSVSQTLSLEKAYDTGKVVKVLIKNTAAGKNCMLAQALTVPYIFVQVKTTKPIEVVTKNAVADCE